MSKNSVRVKVDPALITLAIEPLLMSPLEHKMIVANLYSNRIFKSV